MRPAPSFVSGGATAASAAALRQPWWPHALAAVLYLVGALWAVRVMLPAPASTFPSPIPSDRHWQPIIRSDQRLSAANITWNAHRFLTSPSTLYDAGQCYPASNAATLGPHQLGEGLLGVLPYALTGDPVLTFNTVVVLTLWLPALAMYALVFHFTRSTPAAFIAGLLFAFHPQRIGDVVHPDVHGNQWTPLALLFAHRTFTGGRWRDVGGLILFLGLQVLGSVYPLLALVVIGGTYGVVLALRHARSLLALAPKLAVALGVTAALAWLVLGPYLHTRAAWGTLGGRATLFYFLGEFGPGFAAYPGSVLLVLAAIALADRWHGPRGRAVDDPRLVLLVAGLLVMWSAVWAISIPVLAIQIPSLFTLAARVLPGLDAVRAGAAIGFGVVLVGAFLAGYGVLALLERRSAATRAVLTAVLAVAVLLELFHPRAARQSFGTVVEMQSYPVLPPPSLLALYQKSEGAILDLPYGFETGRFFEMADGVFLSAFHLHPVAACYNSFKLALHEDIQRLAERLGEDPQAIDALHALGFETLAVNEIRRRGKGSYFRLRDAPAAFMPLGQAAGRSLYRLVSTTPVVTDLVVLRATAPAAMTLVAAPPETALAFTFRNGSASTYRHADPIEPTRMRVAWHAGGTVTREDEVNALLPIALAAGGEFSRAITVPVPQAAGDYEVTLAPATAPDLIVARQPVRVR